MVASFHKELTKRFATSNRFDVLIEFEWKRKRLGQAYDWFKFQKLRNETEKRSSHL